MLKVVNQSVKLFCKTLRVVMDLIAQLDQLFILGLNLLREFINSFICIGNGLFSLICEIFELFNLGTHKGSRLDCGLYLISETRCVFYSFSIWKSCDLTWLLRSLIWFCWYLVLLFGSLRALKSTRLRLPLSFIFLYELHSKSVWINVTVILQRQKKVPSFFLFMKICRCSFGRNSSKPRSPIKVYSLTWHVLKPSTFGYWAIFFLVSSFNGVVS